MKHIGGLWIVAALLAPLMAWSIGCSKEEPSGARSEDEGERYYEREVGKNPVEAPADYLYTVTVTAPRRMKETLFLAEISKEIKTFWAFQDRYPESLLELEEWRGAPLPELPRGLGYDYDPETGELRAVEVPLEE